MSDSITRTLCRIVRAVILLRQRDIDRESYWLSLRGGGPGPHLSGSLRSNPLDYAWEARNVPEIKPLLDQLETQLGAHHGGALVRKRGIVTERLGSQAWVEYRVLNGAFFAADNGRTSDGQVRSLARSLYDELAGPVHHWQLVIPLEGLTLKDRTRTQVRRDIVLRVLAPVEREMLLNADMLSLSSPAEGCVARSEVALEHTIPLASDQDLGVTQFNELVDWSKNAVTVLSAALSQDVRLAGFFAAPMHMFPLGVPFSHVPEMPIYEPLDEPQAVSPAAVKRLSALVDSALIGPNSARTLVARHRLFEVMKSSNPVDRLVDAWVALESLFLTDGNAELRFRAALRIAAMADAGSRKDVFEFVKSSYGARSKVIHGELPDPASLKSIADGTVDIARRSLVSVLRLPHRFEPRCLEERLLDPRSRARTPN